MTRIAMVLVATLALTAPACSDDDDNGNGGATDTGSGSDAGGDTGDPVPTFADDIQPIVETYCTPCHVTPGNFATPHVNDTSTHSQDAVSGECPNQTVAECMATRVEAGTMPQDQAPCNPDKTGCPNQSEIDLIKAWAAGGAP